MAAEIGWRMVEASASLRIARFETLVEAFPVSRFHESIDLPTARILNRVVKGVARRLPWRTQCFEQGIAAYRWLHAHGFDATLHYGARGSGDAIEAHVWVTSGDVPVVGCENAAEFRELARYPTG